MSGVDHDSDGVLDMSLGENRQSFTINVSVGNDARKFAIPRHLLNAKSIAFGSDNMDPVTDSIPNDLSLEEDDPDAFNLFVLWLHAYNLPRAQPQPSFPSDPVGTLWMDSKTVMLIPRMVNSTVPEVNVPDFSAVARFRDICAHSQYLSFSLEEIRLADQLRSLLPVTPTYGSFPPGIFQPGGSTDANPLHPAFKRKYSPDTPTTGFENSRVEDKPRNEQTQSVLLKLAMLATKYKWIECFNAAIDNYRAGEKVMRRIYPNLQHIHVAYANIHMSEHDSSPLIRLLVDYAFYSGVRSGIGYYDGIFKYNNDFMSAYLKRLDGISPVHGCLVSRYNGNLQVITGKQGGNTPMDGPLDVAEIVYHMSE
ncbi:hypothetical protein BJ170DRAFT_712868 [Xylariales sp. AK1849]|nr:hypothetical protein BJ170DRAFT_712868 [Xylariales sp. AK1849]